jgi:nicotinamide-nucleotide amidase
MNQATPESDLYALAQTVGDALRARGWYCATAESCTGGWVAQSLTAIPGSSAWFERGFVTYSNQAKQDMLGVRAHTLATYGAVSAETVAEMAAGALRHSVAQISVALSGIAGPDGGSPDKPVGTVWIAWAWPGDGCERAYHFPGSRDNVRRQAVIIALQGLREYCL